MLTPADVVQSSARRSIQRSLMTVLEVFTVHGASGDFVIWCPDIRCFWKTGRNARGLQPKSCTAGAGSKIMSLDMRLPIATFALAINGFASANAARHRNGGTGMIRRGLCNPSKMRPIISREIGRGHV